MLQVMCHLEPVTETIFGSRQVKKDRPRPPTSALRFFGWFCHPKLLKYIEGDLMELYKERVKEYGQRKADFRFIIDVLFLFRPGIIRTAEGHRNLNTLP